MIKIIKHREYETITEYYYFFSRDQRGNSGFSIPCNENGEPFDKWKDRFDELMEQKDEFVWHGLQERKIDVIHPTIGQCVCGEEIELSGFTNTCTNCDRDYNSSGQELAPRSQWGEETGESLSDILSVDSEWK